MSYDITFKGGDSINVSTERGLKVKELWFNGDSKTPIDIDGDAYLVSDIKRIRQSADAKIQVPVFGVLAKGKEKCRGQFSIQSEINQIIKDEHPDDWAQKIQSETFRETIRQRLLTHKGIEWCDYRKGKCACV